MATKQAYAAHEAEAMPFDGNGWVKPLVRIENMREVEPGVFELSGGKPRNIDWPGVAHALGFAGTIPDALADKISLAVAQHDMMKFLLANMK